MKGDYFSYNILNPSEAKKAHDFVYRKYKVAFRELAEYDKRKGPVKKDVFVPGLLGSSVQSPRGKSQGKKKNVFSFS